MSTVPDERPRLADYRKKLTSQIGFILENGGNTEEEKQVQSLLDDLAATLEQAADSTDPDIIADARRIVRLITGGKIMLSQHGEARAQQGWLRGTFSVNLVRPVAEKLDIHTADPEPLTFSIDFRKLTDVEKHADEIKAMVDQGMLYKDIRAALAQRHGHNFRKVSSRRLAQIQRMLNNRPRKCLNYRTPTEVLNALPGVALRN